MACLSAVVVLYGDQRQDEPDAPPQDRATPALPAAEPGFREGANLDEFFASVRSGRPINDGQHMAQTTLMAMMGRMAAYTGQEISWDKALNSREQLVPEQLDWDTKLELPPLPTPGVTPFV